MKMHLFHLKILKEENRTFLISISNGQEKTNISFNHEKKVLNFLQKDNLSEFLNDHEFQLRKLLHVKRPEAFYKNFELNFSIRENKDVKAFNDLNQILVLDKRGSQDKNYVIKDSFLKIHELYIDGSFLQEDKKAGLTVIIKFLDGSYEMKSFKSIETSSCLVELEAAIKGLELLIDEEQIRLITDSQYVRKGLTEWILNWKLNDWHTANGEKVKNIEHWKKFDKLSQNKYIEFKYVKAHSQHFENTMADLYAKDEARK